jgi:hypothetical protein
MQPAGRRYDQQTHRHFALSLIIREYAADQTYRCHASGAEGVRTGHKAYDVAVRLRQPLTRSNTSSNMPNLLHAISRQHLMYGSDFYDRWL